jgi:hypothetical protein
MQWHRGSFTKSECRQRKDNIFAKREVFISFTKRLAVFGRDNFRYLGMGVYAYSRT